VQRRCRGIGTAPSSSRRTLGAQRSRRRLVGGQAATATEAGAHDVVLVDGFKDAVKELTGGRGVDVVVDPVGGDRFTDSLRSLAARAAARHRLHRRRDPAGEGEPPAAQQHLGRGVGWGAFWMAEPPYLQEQWAELLPLVESGELAPVLGASFPLEQASSALLELDERRATGKVLLTVR
jgi:NADPH2:quinone reductase